MDQRTVKAYNDSAKEYFELSQTRRPDRLYDLAKIFFKSDGKTLDIGCGSGRDCLALNAMGFDVTGIDASEELVKMARKNNSNNKIKFNEDSLPVLATQLNSSIENIFCCAVLMHLPPENLLSALARMLEVLIEGGTMILSWRNSVSDSEREGEKLYSHYTGEQVMLLLESLGCKVSYYAFEYADKTRPEIPWYILVVKKILPAHSGLSKIQSYISYDAKTSTYKLALLRALCQIAQIEPHVITFERIKGEGGAFARIPTSKVAVNWVYFYWELFSENIQQIANGNLKVYSILKQSGLDKAEILKVNLQESHPNVIKALGKVIVNYPVRYMGGLQKAGFFGDTKFIYVPADVWRDFVIFGHWIEKSLIFEWSQESARFDKQKRSLGEYFEIVNRDMMADRDQKAIELIKVELGDYSVDSWTGKEINSLEVDHILPFTALRCDHLWNLTPTDARTNSAKSDHIPRPQIIKESKDRLFKVWSLLADSHPERFFREMKLGLNIDSSEFQRDIAVDALIERATHLVNIRGYRPWDS